MCATPPSEQNLCMVNKWLRGEGSAEGLRREKLPPPPHHTTRKPARARRRETPLSTGALYQVSYRRGNATETVKGETVAFEDIPLGNIEVRGLSPSGGYLLDRDAHRIRATADTAQGTSPVIEVEPHGEFGENVRRGSIPIGKGDAERCDHEDEGQSVDL